MLWRSPGTSRGPVFMDDGRWTVAVYGQAGVNGDFCGSVRFEMKTTPKTAEALRPGVPVRMHLGSTIHSEKYDPSKKPLKIHDSRFTIHDPVSLF